MNDSLLGLVGTTNYDSSEFLSNTAYQFSQFLDNQANGLYDIPVDLAIDTDPTFPTNPVSSAIPDNPVSPNVSTDTTVSTDPGETISEALDFGSFDGDGVLVYTESVGGSDSVDLYQFSISQNNNFNFVLGGLSADADLHLVDINGEILAASENYNTDVEILNASLPTGTYFLGVASYDSMDTSYDLHAIGGENTLTSAEISEVIDPTLATTDFVLI